MITSLTTPTLIAVGDEVLLQLSAIKVVRYPVSMSDAVLNEGECWPFIIKQTNLYEP